MVSSGSSGPLYFDSARLGAAVAATLAPSILSRAANISSALARRLLYHPVEKVLIDKEVKSLENRLKQLENTDSTGWSIQNTQELAAIDRELVGLAHKYGMPYHDHQNATAHPALRVNIRYVNLNIRYVNRIIRDKSLYLRLVNQGCKALEHSIQHDPGRLSVPMSEKCHPDGTFTGYGADKDQFWYLQKYFRDYVLYEEGNRFQLGTANDPAQCQDLFNRHLRLTCPRLVEIVRGNVPIQQELGNGTYYGCSKKLGWDPENHFWAGPGPVTTVKLNATTVQNTRTASRACKSVLRSLGMLTAAALAAVRP